MERPGSRFAGTPPTGNYFLVVVDYFCRFFEVAATKSVTSSKMISCLEMMFTSHRFPLLVKHRRAIRAEPMTFFFTIW